MLLVVAKHFKHNGLWLQILEEWLRYCYSYLKWREYLHKFNISVAVYTECSLMFCTSWTASGGVRNCFQWPTQILRFRVHSFLGRQCYLILINQALLQQVSKKLKLEWNFNRQKKSSFIFLRNMGDKKDGCYAHRCFTTWHRLRKNLKKNS